MESKIFVSKLLPPSVDDNIIDRPRLMEKIISANPEPAIVLFNATAGYGKTVLMSQYCKASGKPVIWYQMDSYDNDPAVFLTHLTAGIRQHFRDSGVTLLSRINKPGAVKKQRQFISALFNELTSQTGQSLIIALDDYHSITEPVMHTFMEEFLNCLPPFLQLCIASRTALQFPFSRLSMEGKVKTIDNQAIRFSRDEIISYLGESVHQDDVAEQIERQTEGWPVALRLLKNRISDKESYQLTETKEVFDYLADEVLRYQPDHIQQFLLSTSVLETLTPEHCDLLLGEKDSGKILEFLNKNQLFVTPLEGGGAYRYHQLFREFLLNRLGKEDKSQFYKAGTIAESLGNIEKAIEYFFIAETPEDAVRLIVENGKQILGRGRWQTVREWLSGLSPSRISREPWLILFQAEVEIYMGKLVEAEHLLRKAEALFEKRDLHGLSEALIQQARIMRSRGRYSESIELLDRALSRSLPEEFRKRFDFSIEKSFALVLAGRFKESETELTEALKIAEYEGDGYLIANFSEALSNLYFLKGDYSKSMEMYRRAVNVSTEPVQTSYYMRDSVALIYRDWGELDRALEQAVRSIAVKEKLGLVEVLPYAYYQLASIQADLEDLTGAEENYRRSISIARETGGEQVFLIMSLAMLAKLLTTQNRFTEASSLAEEAVNLSSTQSPYVIAFTKEMIAPVLVQTGRAQEAVQILFEAAAVLDQVGAKYPLCIAYGALAAVLFMKGDAVATAEHSRKCLELAARENYLQIFISSYNLFQPVLRAGLEQGVEILFVQRVLMRLGERGVDLMSNLAASPVPEVRRRIIIPMAEIGGVQAERTIQSLIEDPAPEVRGLAEDMARRIGIVRVNQSSKSVIPLLRFDMLGVLRVYINGEESTTANWTTLKSRDLLTYLAHCGEAVTRGRILEDLWPGMDHEKSSHLFHTTLYNLRKTLKRKCNRNDLIVYAAGKYRLCGEIFITDRDRFKDLLSTAKKTAESPETAISYINEAIRLYRGDYLAEMDYSWLILIREHLELLYLQALKQLGCYYMELQDYSYAVSYLRILSANDPFAEDVFCMLMKAYAAAGNLMMVNEIYHSLTDSLDKELGIAPSEETNELYKQLTGVDLQKK